MLSKRWIALPQTPTAQFFQVVAGIDLFHQQYRSVRVQAPMPGSLESFGPILLGSHSLALVQNSDSGGFSAVRSGMVVHQAGRYPACMSPGLKSAEMGRAAQPRTFSW